MAIFEIFVGFIQWLSPYFSWIVRGTLNIMSASMHGAEQNGERSTGEEKRGARPTVTANVVGKDSDGFTSKVTATGLKCGKKSLAEAIGNSDVIVNATGIKNGEANEVNVIGLCFE